MTPEVVIFAKGYSVMDPGGTTMRANCSCVLVKDSGVNIIVDTMTAWDSEIILKALEKEQLSPEDIHFVINTHGHSDHCGGNHLFLKAKHMVGDTISHRDMFEFHDFNGKVHERSVP